MSDGRLAPRRIAFTQMPRDWLEVGVDDLHPGQLELLTRPFTHLVRLLVTLTEPFTHLVRLLVTVTEPFTHPVRLLVTVTEAFTHLVRGPESLFCPCTSPIHRRKSLCGTSRSSAPIVALQQSASSVWLDRVPVAKDHTLGSRSAFVRQPLFARRANVSEAHLLF